MQYTTLFLAALSATGSLAAPLNARQAQDQEQLVTVALLADVPEDTQQQFQLGDGKAVATKTFNLDPAAPTQATWDQVTIKLDPKVENKELRCAVFDKDNKPIEGKRGENIDTTFADGGEAKAWTFTNADQIVSQIICDPIFKKGEGVPADYVVTPAPGQGTPGPGQGTPVEGVPADKVQVRLRKEKGDEKFVSFDFTEAETKDLDLGSIQWTKWGQQYKSVEVKVGQNFANKGIRCTIADKERENREVKFSQITAYRGENQDTTFADGDKGEWTIGVIGSPKASKVKAVMCSEAFKQKNQNQDAQT